MSEWAAERGERLVAAALNLAVDATAMEVAGALERAHVPSIVLKGPALTEWLYGSDSTRFSVDLDVLVASERLEDAEAVLRALRYEPIVPEIHATDRPRYARVWHRRSGGVNVDLHTTLAGVRVSSEEAWRILEAETQTTTAVRAHVQVLNPSAQALHLALHAAKHGKQEGKHLRDLERAVETLLPEVWRQATALAARLDALPAFTSGLSLVPQGHDLTARLGLTASTSVETELRAQSAPPLALGLAWLAQLPGARAKAAFVAAKIVPPPAFMRRWHPLARRGRLGLAAAYLYRPVWLLLRLRPAIAAWRRAKKASGASR